MAKRISWMLEISHLKYVNTKKIYNQIAQRVKLKKRLADLDFFRCFLRHRDVITIIDEGLVASRLFIFQPNRQ